MSSNAIIVRQNEKETSLELPPPQHENAKAIYKTLPRMERWFPEHRESEKMQFYMAVASSINRKTMKQVTPASITKSAFNAAALGLLPDTIHGYCHFVPLKKDKGKNTERIECELWIGYRGFLELAFGSGFLSSLTTEIVLKGEQCRRWNDSNGAQIEHEIPLDRPDEPSIKIVDIEAAYMIYKTLDGSSDVELTSGRTLRSLAKRGNVWYSNPVPMSRKTPIRRGAKRWRISGDRAKYLAGAIALDEQQETGRTQSLLVPDDPTAEPPETVVSGETLDLKELGLTKGSDLPGAPTPEEQREIEEMEGAE